MLMTIQEVAKITGITVKTAYAKKFPFVMVGDKKMYEEKVAHEYIQKRKGNIDKGHSNAYSNLYNNPDMSKWYVEYASMRYRVVDGQVLRDRENVTMSTHVRLVVNAHIYHHPLATIVYCVLTGTMPKKKMYWADSSGGACIENMTTERNSISLSIPPPIGYIPEDEACLLMDRKLPTLLDNGMDYVCFAGKKYFNEKQVHEYKEKWVKRWLRKLPEGYLTIADAAKFVGVSYFTIKKNIHKKILQYKEDAGRSLIKIEDLIAFKEQRLVRKYAKTIKVAPKIVIPKPKMTFPRRENPGHMSFLMWDLNCCPLEHVENRRKLKNKQ